MTNVAGINCLVLGGGGFIGTNLCNELVRRGALVRGYGRLSKYSSSRRDITWFQAEFNDRVSLARAIEGTEIIFHLIGGSVPESSNKDPIADLASSVIPTLHLLEICRNSSVRKIVFISSGGTVYGPAAPTPTPETAATDPASAYGISKLSIEKYFGLYNHLYNVDYCVLRLANPYGPFQDPNRRQGVISALMTRAMLKQDLEIWGSGEIIRDFIYVDDAVEAIIAASAYGGPCKTFNVGSGRGRSINQVVEDVIRVVKMPGIKVIHRAGRATDVPVSVLDIGLIRQELGWNPQTDWMKGLEAAADWIRGSYI